jgi:hypothetical protein
MAGRGDGRVLFGPGEEATVWPSHAWNGVVDGGSRECLTQPICARPMFAYGRRRQRKATTGPGFEHPCSANRHYSPVIIRPIIIGPIC